MSMEELKEIAKDQVNEVTTDVLKLNMTNTNNGYIPQIVLLKTFINNIISQCNPFATTNTIPKIINDIEQIIKNELPDTFELYIAFDNQILRNGKKITIYTKNEIDKIVPLNIDIAKISYSLFDKNPLFRHSHIPSDIHNCHKKDDLLKLYEMFGKYKNVKFVDNELCDFIVKFIHFGL